MDVLTPEQRQRNMSRIRARNTRPEMMIRTGLHARGYRYRLHDRRLPGTPDLVFGSRRVVIFVHGCFWHGHDCSLSRPPATRPEFWAAKVEGNRRRDEAVLAQLAQLGWRVVVVWECALRGRRKLPTDSLFTELERALDGSAPLLTIRGGS